MTQEDEQVSTKDGAARPFPVTLVMICLVFAGTLWFAWNREFTFRVAVVLYLAAGLLLVGSRAFRRIVSWSKPDVSEHLDAAP